MPRSERQLQLERLYEAGGGTTEALSEDDGVWGHVIRLQRWLSGTVTGVEPVVPEVVLTPRPGEDASALFALCVLMRHAATLRLDGTGVVAAVDRMRQLATLFPQVGGSALELSIVWEGWVLATPDAERAAALAHGARERGDAKVTVEAQILRGLHELAQNQVTGAVQTLRRASRMARVESVPTLEVFSGIALARARRFQGRPQLALRILRAVAPHAPPPWNRWLCWEAALSGARFESGRQDRSILGVLLQACDASEEGDVLRSRASLDALALGAESFAAFRHDARSAAALLSVDVRAGEGVAPAAVEAWIHGKEDEVPPALRGFAFASHVEQSGESCALLLASHEGRARRVLPRSLPLAVALGFDAGPAAAPTHPRADSGLATLAFRQALPLGAYFEAVYAYPFDPSVHRAMVNMHVKRMRERVGDCAEILREGDTIALRVERSMIVRDARCEESTEDRVLGVLARSDAKSASDLARELKLPLRSVQRILKELQVDAGVEQRKEGRNVRYAVEDTTFSEPTRTRRFEAVLGR